MSRTIGNMTLKATPVGTDMVAIADSEDLDKTKKVLLSALSGGSDMIHVLDDTVTWSNPTYSATGAGITQYEDGHFYLIKFPSISGVINEGRNLNINNLGGKSLDFNYSNQWLTNRRYILPTTPETSIVLYRSSTDRFYFITSTSKDCVEAGYYGSVEANDVIVRGDYVYQLSRNIDSSTPTITIAINGTDHYHVVYYCSLPLTSLTINVSAASSRWETEIDFTTDSTFTLTITGSNLKWLGDAAPTFDPNTSYVIAIKNGYGVCSKVVP